ncbi:MAG: amidohydrolase family protein, partial [Leptothrix sp. (in: b-proteobacteria)]
ATGTGIAHCPQSNGRLGSGIAPIPALLRAGAPVSLAVDGAASNEAADMLSEAHACWLLQRAASGADALSVGDVIRLGTAGGAQVLGLDAVGTLAPGMAADLVLYELDQPRHFGLHDPGVAPVACGFATARAVLVGGRVVVEHGQIPGLDLAALRAEAAAAVAVMQAHL